MKFELTDYQAYAVSDTIAQLDEARGRFDRRSKNTAVSLSAPTGAGKTVIATAVIDQLFYGGPDVEANPDQVVLWITDDPSLNEQTKRKMLIASTRLTPSQLVTVDDTLDQRRLDPGYVYFLNIQKLGKGATTYVNSGDRRQFGLWTILANTVRDAGADLLVVVDEAHRGTSSNGRRKTIASKIIAGDDAHPAAPIVLGISATPDRFIEAVLAEGSRALEQHNVDVDEVRKSGLIKDLIAISHPTETQPGDLTLLAMAAKELKRYDALWDAYTDKQDEPVVRPALVVQVGDSPSEAELDRILATLEETWDELSGDAVGHAFQEHARLTAGRRSIRYVSPPDIQDDPKLRVVLFKEALTTGWDCPRAEVMISLRSRQDHTYIAQLIGRMVRTPLARRVESDEQLNSVALYLPHYDEESVTSVVTNLTGGDTEVASDITTNRVTCSRNSDVPEGVWEVLAGLPTYTRPSKLHRSDIDRLQRYAFNLEECGVLERATDKAQDHLIDTMRRESGTHAKAIARIVADLEQLDTAKRTYGVFDGEVASEETASYAVDSRNIDDLYRRAWRKLTHGLASAWWDAQLDGGALTDDEAKLRVAAYAEVDQAVAATEKAAVDLIATWRTEFHSKITALREADYEAIKAIYRQSRSPQQVKMSMPSDIEVDGAAAASFPKHVYAPAKGNFPAARLNDWERRVIETALAKGAVAWYRNPSAGSRALGVPYDSDQSTLYPDFILFHTDDDGELHPTIIDPHRPDLADTSAKWSGLAAYARKHADSFAGVHAVIVDDQNRVVFIDLRDKDVAKAISDASSEAEIRKVFADHGGKY